MAINFLNTINFNQNELENVVIDPTGSAPTTTEGAMYYDTTDDIMYYRNASAWVPMDGSGTGVTTFTNEDGTFISAGTVNTAATGAVTTGIIDLSATGAAGVTTFLRGDNTWATPTDTDTTYTLPTTDGANPDLVLTASSGGTDIVNLDGTGTTVEVTGSTNDTITFDLVDDVTIVTSLTVNSGAAATRSVFGYQVTIPATPLTSTDAASKGYVDGLVEGGLTFKGTFDANDGEIVSGGSIGLFLYQLTGTAFDPTAVRVAVEVGDYYVVATAGDFYGDSGTGTCSPTRALTIGDSIIAVLDAAADTSVCADWSIIESDEGVTDFTNEDGTFISAGTVNTGATGSVTMGIIDLSATGVAGATNFLRGDNSWVVPTDTTYVMMTSTTLGLGKLEDDTEQSVAANAVTTTASRTYGIQANSSDQLVVNVPWTDTTGAITSVTASAVNDELGLIIDPTTGAVVAGIDIKGTTNLGTAPALDDEILLYDLDGDVNKAITVENLMQSATNGAYAVLNTTTTGVTQQVGPPAGTEGWVIAVDTILSATAAIHVACEVIRVSDGHTVYASVERATTNITVNFVGSSIPQGTYAVILNRVA